MERNTTDQPFTFSTKRYDEKTGLNYYGYRYYNPAIGKWLTRDPLGEAGGMNLYGFVENSPIKWVDPNGLSGIAFDAGGGYGTGWGKKDPGAQSASAGSGFYIGKKGDVTELGGFFYQSQGKTPGARFGLGVSFTRYYIDADKFFKGTMKYKSRTIGPVTFIKYFDRCNGVETGWSISILGKGIGITGLKEGTSESWSYDIP